MLAPAALFLVLLLGGSPCRAARNLPYDAKAAPLDELSHALLIGNGYQFREDGAVWDKIADAPVPRDEMPYLISRLASARRLKALLEINMIFNKYESRRAKLSPEDHEAVRTIVRGAWSVFGVGPRREFRGYFTVEELARLDKIPPRVDSASPLSMRDPDPESATDPAAGRQAAAAEAAAAVPASLTAAAPPSPERAPAAPQPPATVRYPPTLPPILEPLSLRRRSPFAPAPAAPPDEARESAPAAPASEAPAVVMGGSGSPPPVMLPPNATAALPPLSAPAAPAAAAPPFAPAPAAPAPAMAAPASAAPVTPAALQGFGPGAPVMPALPAQGAAIVRPAPTAPAPSAAKPAPTAPGDGLGQLKPWTPEAAESAEAPAPVALPVQPAAPAPVAASPADYDRFVENGPYGRESKALLQLIGRKAPEFCLPLLRRTVIGAVPQVLIDGSRGGGLRGGYENEFGRSPIAAVSAGPVFVERKKGFFGAREALLLPESPRAWEELGINPPALDSLRRQVEPSAAQDGPWGAVKGYPDGSRRGSYFPQQQAGELLEQLLLLGLEREGLSASPYAARRWARTARLLFFLRLKEELANDAFLDPDRRAELREWMDRPEEAEDLQVAAWSSARGRVLDPRRGPPESARGFELRARTLCRRAALEDGMVEAAARRARRVGTLESLLDAGLVDKEHARLAAQAAADQEKAAKEKLLKEPPPCPPADPARDEALRKSVLLIAEAARAERVLRQRRAGGSDE